MRVRKRKEIKQMITMREREKEILTKACLTLSTMSCRAENGIEEKRLEKAAEMLEQILDDYE